MHGTRLHFAASLKTLPCFALHIPFQFHRLDTFLAIRAPGRRKRTRIARPMADQQASRLLSLPPEIRTTIYELVCTNFEKVVLIPGSEPAIARTANPVSRTCQQLWWEFSPIYAANAANHASELVCHVHNFHLCNKARVHDYLEQLPTLPQGRPRIFTQEVFLDNTFDPKFELGNVFYEIFVPLPSPGYQSFQARISIHFDSKTFDVAYLRSSMARFAPSWASRHYCEVWRAVDDAIERHEARRAEAARSRRGRKRNTKTRTKAAVKS